MQKLNELIDLVKICREKCPWCREQTIESFSLEILSEAKELEEAIGKKNVKEIKEELGDLLWDVIMLMHIAEHNNLFSSDEVIKLVNEKMKRRKPYILKGEEVTLDQAMSIWKEQKLIEKRSK